MMCSLSIVFLDLLVKIVLKLSKVCVDRFPKRYFVVFHIVDWQIQLIILLLRLSTILSPCVGESASCGKLVSFIERQ